MNVIRNGNLELYLEAVHMIAVVISTCRMTCTYAFKQTRYSWALVVCVVERLLSKPSDRLERDKMIVQALVFNFEVGWPRSCDFCVNKNE